jgi:hypothetical protein
VPHAGFVDIGIIGMAALMSGMFMPDIAPSDGVPVVVAILAILFELPIRVCDYSLNHSDRQNR